MNLAQWALLIGIALGNNLDNTGVGLAYGLSRIRIPYTVNGWISVVTFLITGGAVFAGDWLGGLLPVTAAKFLSAGILCTIGVLMLRGTLGSGKSGNDPAPTRSAATAVKPAGVLDVLHDPERADADRSRHIDYKEGTLLGVALSINNIGGGVSAGLIHLSIFWTALVSAAISFFVLWLGGVIGKFASAGRFADRTPAIAGVLLIVIGIFQFR